MALQQVSYNLMQLVAFIDSEYSSHEDFSFSFLLFFFCTTRRKMTQFRESSFHNIRCTWGSNNSSPSHISKLSKSLTRCRVLKIHILYAHIWCKLKIFAFVGNIFFCFFNFRYISFLFGVNLNRMLPQISFFLFFIYFVATNFWITNVSHQFSFHFKAFTFYIILVWSP